MERAQTKSLVKKLGKGLVWHNTAGRGCAEASWGEIDAPVEPWRNGSPVGCGANVELRDRLRGSWRLDVD